MSLRPFEKSIQPKPTIDGDGVKLPTSDDLEIAFARIREEVRERAQVVFRVVVEGQPRALHPSIRDEVYRIGREALLNAFRHSEARQVEVNLEYAPKRLRITVRDDGKGVSPEMFRSGGCDHRGLSWMQQLAERIGRRLRLFSRPAAGTEVELSIPGRIAFGLHTRAY